MTTLLTAGLAFAPAATAFAAEPGTVTLKKTASAETVQPGETFTYTITVGCTTFGEGCVNAAITDAVPAEFLITGQPVVTGAPGTATVDGQTVTVTFTSSFSDGTTGLPAATTAQVQISVRVDPELPYSADGVPVTNTAEIDADNTDPAEGSVVVTPTVPLELDVAATKELDPERAIAEPGRPVTATITATGDSNAAVDFLRVTDPPDPEAEPNPFEYLAFDGFGDVTFPEGADRVQVDVWNGTAWVAGEPATEPELPADVSADEVRGLRFTFTNAAGDRLPADASASIELDLVQRDNVDDLTAETTVTNTVTAEVGRGEETATSDPATDDFTIVPQEILAEAGKNFDPDPIAAGDSSTVTLTGTNAGTDVDSMVITEPAPGSRNPFRNGLTFAGFTEDVVWPAGAESATVTYTYDDGSSEELSTDEADTLPPPADGKTVTGFTVAFTGDITEGAEASIPFTVDSDIDQSAEEVEHPNRVHVEVSRGDRADTATAADTLTTIAERLDVTVDKRITPSEILSVPGQTAIVQLPARIKPFPDSTTDATHLIVQDPRTVPPDPSPDEFWNSFDAKAITQTAIPSGATLTVYYWDGSDWQVLPGAEDLAGPDVVNIPIPAELRDDIQGLKFDYHDPDGFEPGTAVQPNVTVELRDEKRDGSGPAAGDEDTLSNCASASASAGDVSAEATTPEPCPSIDLIPVDGGSGDLISKEFIEPEPGAGKTVTARSGERIDAKLHWSTGGYSGLDEVVVSDVADPETTDLADSHFNAFNLVAIPAIGAADDPWLTYDAVTKVELWNGSAWVRAGNDPCPGACDGTFPGLTLTEAEQESTTGVRLVYVESPTRADRIGDDPTLPQVGDGVSRSSRGDRDLTLTFQIRDEVRDPEADPDPVLGSREYNVDGSPGEVRDTARATGNRDGEQVVTDTGADEVLIIDVPLNVDVTKDWTGGPLGVPPAGTDADAYPSGRMSVTATNRTAAKVDTLVIAEPDAADPFDVFDVKDLVSITVPDGATKTVVTLTRASGDTDYGIDEALGLSEADLADVTGITVTHTGRIDAGATAALVLDARLRAEHRGSGDPVTEADSPVRNDTKATVKDLGGTDDDKPTATDDASITLADVDISVTAAKSFKPSTIVEPDAGPVTMTVSGQPGGSSRTVRMVLTDAEPRLWNQYDFTGFGSFAFVRPIDRVRVDAYTGGTFGVGADGVMVTGGSWHEGEESTSLKLPAGVAPGDVQGLRFTFTRADGAIWENPANPKQTVPIQLTRRDTMRSGGEVLTDLTGNAPAPGETEPGIATNTLDATAYGAITVDGEPISATDDAEAKILYKHADNSVKVVKLADGEPDGGVKAPGVPFPYTIKVTNTGNRAIVDPRIRDVLPTTGGKAQLNFDPETNPGGAGAFQYTLDGDAPDPANGPAMPTDPADVNTAVTGAVEEIGFSFPAGTVLEVGQTYTITIQLMVNPGVAADSVVTNTAGVTGDRPWDHCEDTLDPDTGECRAEATVKVSSTASMRSKKSVRAVDDELGVNSTTGGDCEPNSAGFYVSPCVPVTKPGGDEVWRTNIVNTGNIDMSHVVGVDVLPRVGDTGGINDNPRGSQWRPVFEGTMRIVSGLPDGATVKFWWTDDPSPCKTYRTCTGDHWIPFPQDGGPAFTEDVLDQVRALRFLVTFPEDQPFEPQDTLTWEFTTTTPAYSETAGKDTIAWNSAATTALTTAGEMVPPTEGQKVGVALATGHIAIRKEVDGDGADFAPDEFELRLSCVSAKGTRLEEKVPLGDEETVTIEAGQTVTVTDLPWGAECTVTEDSGAFATDFTASTELVAREDTDPAVITAVNSYRLAGLVVRKKVESDAVDADGKPIEYGSFTIRVVCVFNGVRVYGDGNSADDPMTAELSNGEEAEFTGLPAGARCVVSESEDGDAAVSMTTTSGDADPKTTEGDKVVITLSPDDGTQTANFATVTNTYGAGDIRLLKKVVGGGASPIDPAGPFTVRVRCTLDDAAGEREVYDGTVRMGGGDPLEVVIEDIAAGAVCSITEPDDAGATFVFIRPDEVTVGDGEEVAVKIFNVMAAGRLVVTKEVVGDGAELYGGGPFTVELACVFDTGSAEVDVRVPDGPTRTITTEEPAVYEGLPANAECVLSEPESGGSTKVTVSGGDGGNGDTVTIKARRTVELTVTNRFDLGGLTVTKRIAGDGAAAHRGEAFTVALACTREVNGERVEVDIPGGATREAKSGGTADYTDLPAGATCTLTEPGSGGAHQVDVDVEDSGSAKFTVAGCEDATCDTAEVTNTWTDSWLPVTGIDGPLWAGIAALLVLAGALLVRYRRGDALDLGRHPLNR